MRNPCLKCDHKDGDKNAPACMECDDRINYVATIEGWDTGSQLNMKNCGGKFGCGKSLPATTEFFYKLSVTNKLDKTCKKCRDKRAMAGRVPAKKERADETQPPKPSPGSYLVIDLADHPGIHNGLKGAAKKHFRTLDNEILYALKNWIIATDINSTHRSE